MLYKIIFWVPAVVAAAFVAFFVAFPFAFAAFPFAVPGIEQE